MGSFGNPFLLNPTVTSLPSNPIFVSLPSSPAFIALPPSRRYREIASFLAPSSSLDSTKTPSKTASKTPFKTTSKTLYTLSKTLVTSSVAAFVLHLSHDGGTGGGGSFSGGGGGNGGGGSGGGGGVGGFFSFFSRFRSRAIAKDEESPEWDSHGLPANIIVQLNKLSPFKRYKVSEILFFDLRRRTTVGTEDSFFEMVSLRPGAVYTKSQLQKELESLATCGMFEKVDLEGKTKPDGTIGVTISFTESTWQSADAFRCINVGLLPQSKPIEMDPDMTDREKMEYFRSQERDYRRRIDEARDCMLPTSVRKEIQIMLREQGKVSARLLQRIRDRVQKWYHDEGYACAQVVNFGNLNTREVVCEVVEGDITQMVVQFQDKLGNVIEGNTQLPVVWRELPRQVLNNSMDVCFFLLRL